jgi:O-antigen ligase
MKDEILNILKENLIIKISFILILLFPIALLAGSLVVNTSIILMNIFFLIHVISEKKFKIFNNDIFYLLLALWVFLILNTLLNDNFSENYKRSFSFLRFILLIFSFSYFLSYKNFKYKKVIFNFWSLILLIVSLDLIFEFFFGFNTLGFKSAYDGRLAGFMGDELKIGHWFFCFSLIIFGNNFFKNKYSYFIFFSLIIISFFIGERANFIRLFIAFFSFVIITKQLNFKNSIIYIVPIILLFLFIGNINGGKLDFFKDRFINVFVSQTKHDSILDFNNNNKYTPLFVNAYTIFKENKLLGVGLGSYYEKSHEIYRTYRFRNYTRMIPNTHPHQYHFEILATLGLPGYIFIFSFLIYFMHKSFRYYLASKETINLSSLLVIFVFCIPLIPTGSFFTTYGASIFWLNFSLMNLGNFKNINY